MMTPAGDLENQVGPDDPSGADHFTRDGWVVGRGVLPIDAVRAARQPVVERLMQLQLIEARPDDPDRYRWVGVAAALSGVNLNALQANLPLVRPGHARRAIERLWGRPAALWTNNAVFLSLPEHASPGDAGGGHAHRDGWQPLGYGQPDEHFNCWIPLTSFGAEEGSLALVPGSHRSDDQAEVIKGFRSRNGTTITAFGFRTSRFAGRWRASAFSVGDALLFRPDLIHAATVNRGEDVRIALVVRGQDGRVALPPAAGFPDDYTQAPGPIELAVLSQFVERPLRIYDVWKASAPHGSLGRYRPLPQAFVTELVEHLRDHGLLENWTDDDDRELMRLSAAGRDALRAWVEHPTATLDQLPLELPLKLELRQYFRLPLRSFIAAQRAQLVSTMHRSSDEETAPASEDHVHAAWSEALVDATNRLLDTIERFANLEGASAS